MDDLRNIQTKSKNEKKMKITNFKVFLNKNKWKVLIIILIFFILFFPSFSGSILGKWITKFVGSLLKNIVI